MSDKEGNLKGNLKVTKKRSTSPQPKQDDDTSKPSDPKKRSTSPEPTEDDLLLSQESNKSEVEPPDTMEVDDEVDETLPLDDGDDGKPQVRVTTTTTTTTTGKVKGQRPLPNLLAFGNANNNLKKSTTLSPGQRGFTENAKLKQKAAQQIAQQKTMTNSEAAELYSATTVEIRNSLYRQGTSPMIEYLKTENCVNDMIQRFIDIERRSCQTRVKPAARSLKSKGK